MTTHFRFPAVRLLLESKSTVREYLEDATKKFEDWSEEDCTNLKNALNHLRFQYRETDSPNYKNDLWHQVAYGLAYYPYHMDTLVNALATLEFKLPRSWNLSRTDRPLDRGPIRLALIGSGPAPELYGLLRFLRNQISYVDQNKAISNGLEIHLIDSNYQEGGWNFLLENLTLKNIRDVQWMKSSIDGNKIRILKNEMGHQSLNEILGEGTRFDGIFSQFMVNELSARDLVLFLEQVMANLADDGFMVINDLVRKSSKSGEVLDEFATVQRDNGQQISDKRLQLVWGEEVGKFKMDQKTSDFLSDQVGWSEKERKRVTYRSFLLDRIS